MSLDNEYALAVANEVHRLRIAEKWARVNPSEWSKQFDRGREDRVAGRPCRSANGGYLAGWYSV